MADKPLIEDAAWHEKLAFIHSQPANSEATTFHENEALKLEARAEQALKDRRVEVQQRAKEYMTSAKKHRFLSVHNSTNQNAEAQLTHEIVAAQLKAVAEGKNPTVATHKLFQQLLALKSAPMTAAIKKHPTAKNLGIV